MELTGDLGKDRELLESVLRCSKWLELRTAKLYKLLSIKLVNDEAASLMKVIAYQSRSHARTIEALMKIFGIPDIEVPEEVCEELMKPVGPVTTKLIRRVMRAEEVSAKKYDELVKELEFLECGVGEEAYTRILLPLLKDVLKDLTIKEVGEGGEWLMKARIVDELVNDVVRQEKLHEFLVREAQKLLHKQQIKNPKHHLQHP